MAYAAHSENCRLVRGRGEAVPEFPPERPAEPTVSSDGCARYSVRDMIVSYEAAQAVN